MRSERTAQQVIGMMHICHPVAHRLVDRVLQGARPGVDGSYLRAKQLHSEDIQTLATHVLCAHVNDALQPKQRAHSCSRDAVLTCACLGNDALFLHAARQQSLAQGIVDFVRAGMEKIFAFQVNLRSANVCRQSLRVKQWRRSPGVIAEQLVEFAPELVVGPRAQELFGKLLQGRDQDFWNVASAKLTPVSVFVGLASCDS